MPVAARESAACGGAVLESFTRSWLPWIRSLRPRAQRTPHALSKPTLPPSSPERRADLRSSTPMVKPWPGAADW